MARAFNGTTDIATVNCNLSGQNKVTLSLWLQFAANNPGIIFEYSAGIDGFDAALGFTATTARVRSYGPTLGWDDSFPVPLDGLWHHYLFVINATDPTQFNKVWIDGTQVLLTPIGHGANTYTWANTVLTLAGRVGVVAPMAGNLGEVALWNGQANPSTSAAPDNTAKALYAGFDALRVWPINPPTIYVPFLGDSPEVDYSGNRTTVTLTGTPAVVAGPPSKSLWMR